MPLEIQLRTAQPLDLTADVLVVGVLQAGQGADASLVAPRRRRRARGRAREARRQGGVHRQARPDAVARDARPHPGREGRAARPRREARPSAPPRCARSRRRPRARRTPRRRSRSRSRCPPGSRASCARSARGSSSAPTASRSTSPATASRRRTLASVVVGVARQARSRTRRRCSRSVSASAPRVNLSRDLQQRAAERPLPRDASPPAAEGVAKEHGPQDPGLRLQGDPPPRDEAHRRRRPRQRARAALRAHRRARRRAPKRKLVFVGKGITFDSGGLSIKPAAGHGRDEARHERRGERRRRSWRPSPRSSRRSRCTPSRRCAENMPDGNAYRPGDIWGSLDGKTVEIINTDAEGRLVLADALAYARALDARPPRRQRDPHRRVRRRARQRPAPAGTRATRPRRASSPPRSRQSGEQMWRMPLLEDLREQLKSDVADLKQTGDRWGGSITAALFLREFVGDAEVGPLRHRGPGRDRPPERLDAGQGRDRPRRAHVPRADRARGALSVLPRPMERPRAQARAARRRPRDRRLRDDRRRRSHPRRRQRRQGQLHDAAPAARAAARRRCASSSTSSTSTRATPATRATCSASTWRARATTSR